MEPRKPDGGADRPGPARGDTTGRVLVIGPYRRARRGEDSASAGGAVRNPEARLEEAVGLARAINLTVAASVAAPLSEIRPATYLGKGKVEEMTGLIRANDVDLVVMDCALSPIQQRNLEKEWNV